ncbi:uncharacterized protein BDW43DRAFT_199965 [Aspergillus alliaceus]|uniref:uncharacterized protein n=1 Tax=Petromyces alliaceus TaxID=209559 RepID=UPI0012A5A1B7|nr:uncharacterized protein BDW43DRAFT_199965 [Aspergillus alliaceus]KAB8237084.1 hypothetical protein BDW43DRAFT_199965 [Aspergillus alliaceus]
MFSIPTRALLSLYAAQRNGLSSTHPMSYRIPPQAPTFPLRSFSTRFPLANKQKGSSNSDSNEPLEIPALNFEAMGLSKRSRAAVIVILCCLGTMETWFWCKAIWRWWKGKTEDVEPVQAVK